MYFQISERSIEDITILDLGGQLTFVSIKSFNDAIDGALSREKKKILLNFENVSYIDSSGIGSSGLVGAFTRVHRAGGVLKLLNLTKKVHDLLQITKLYTVFDVTDNEADAIHKFQATKYCVCPVCGNRTQPPLVDPSWKSQTCYHCNYHFKIDSCPDINDMLLVESVRIRTYFNEYVDVLSGAPFTVYIIGRLDLFTSSALPKAWRILPIPRRVILDLQLTSEIEPGGWAELLKLLAIKESNDRAVVSSEGLGLQRVTDLKTDQSIFSDRCSALAALGDVSDTPQLFMHTVKF